MTSLSSAAPVVHDKVALDVLNRLRSRIRCVQLVGNLATKSRVEREKSNKYRCKYHSYSLAEEAGFNGDCGRVVSSFRLSNDKQG